MHSNPLCCCEYYDINEERNHLLACCCNCHDLDESFESLITCNEISVNRRTSMLATILDRCRIPWKGGAKQVTPDTVLPILTITVAFLIASINLQWTIFVAFLVLILLWYLLRCLPRRMPWSKFFFIWTCYSGVILFFIFEYLVVPLLEILLKENVIVGLFTLGFIVCVIMMRRKAEQLQVVQGAIGKSEGNRNMHCSICLQTVPEGDFHSYWFDCCIGLHNQFYYLMAKLFAIFALIYSAQLTLTSVCHPFTVYDYILLPDDCSDVYQDIELGLSFVSACYSLVVAFIFIINVIQQIFLTSMGLTWHEWKDTSWCQKILCCFINRPHTKGFLVNWYRSIYNSVKK